MKFKEFYTKTVGTRAWIGWTARKFINHARKMGLQDYSADMQHFIGHKLTPKQLAEFSIKDNRTCKQTRDERNHMSNWMDWRINQARCGK